jgi:hypothetical protein
MRNLQPAHHLRTGTNTPNVYFAEKNLCNVRPTALLAEFEAHTIKWVLHYLSLSFFPSRHTRTITLISHASRYIKVSTRVNYTFAPSYPFVTINIPTN